MAIFHAMISNLTDDELKSLFDKVRINGSLTPKDINGANEKIFGNAKNALDAARYAMFKIIVATALSGDATAITIPPFLTGDGVISINAKPDCSKGCNGKHLEKTGVGIITLIGHELQHAVQIIKDGTKDGQGFMNDYIDDFLNQYQYGLNDLVLGNISADDLKRKAYNGNKFEIEAYAIQHALEDILNDPTNQIIFNKACSALDETKGLKSLDGNLDVNHLRVYFKKAFDKRLKEQKMLRVSP